jgi:hypothetical protein
MSLRRPLRFRTASRFDVSFSSPSRASFLFYFIRHLAARLIGLAAPLAGLVVPGSKSRSQDLSRLHTQLICVHDV